MPSAIERIETGIPGLDKLIEGGFVKGSANLLAGSTGTGKTIFGCQFLLNGAKKGEKGLYLTLEQRETDIINDVKRFTWGVEFENFLKNKKITMYRAFPSSIKELTDTTFNQIKLNGAKLFVLDSISVAAMGWKEATELTKIRRGIFDLMDLLKEIGVTSLLISEIPEENPKAISRFGFEEFLADSMIILHYMEYAAAGTPRSLMIRKMRRTSHKNDIFQMIIGEDGIKISSPKKGLVL